MSRLLDLKEKRARAWEEAKKLLDSCGGETMSGEDLEKYEKMESDIENMTREISALERAEAFETKMKAATSNPITGAPTTGPAADDKTGKASDEYKGAFWDRMRYNQASNALTVGTDSEGGYLAPDEFERHLVEGLSEENIFRTIATTINTTSGERKIPVVASHGTATWLEEGATLTDSSDTFGQKVLGAYKLGTLIKVSEELLQDSAFNLDAYIAREFARRIGTKEEEAFFIGNGTNKPTGIFNTTGGADVGATTAAATAITFDNIYDLFYSLKAPYRKTATWTMNDATIKAVRKLKDENGQYLWQPSVSAGTPDTLLNRPIKTSSYVPTIAAGAKVIAFGDFSYYWIADRQGRSFKRLNERYAEEGMVGFIATERVDGKLILPEAIKVLSMAS